MREILEAGLQDLRLPTQGIPALLRYGEMLIETNQVMNLTAITAPSEVARLHFLDSAALLGLLDFTDKSVADIGTGAGFPGLPLKIVEPSIHLTLLDSLQKRVNFLQGVCDDLGLGDVQCVHGRAEEFAAGHREQFDIVTSRAVAALPMLAELCLPLVRVGGVFAPMKSTASDEELSAAAHAIALLGGQVEKVNDYLIPGTDVRHRLMVIRKIQPSPAKYPRAFGKIKKNPL